MAQEIIYIGSAPNDGAGDPLRTAFTKVNNNFTQLFAATITNNTVYTASSADQILFSANAATMAGATVNVYTCDTMSGNSQSVTIEASTNCQSSGVRFSAHSTLFHGDALLNYSMDIVNGNVVLYGQPFTANLLVHSVSSKVRLKPEPEVGLAIALEGVDYANTWLSTENNLYITTEAIWDAST